jgi:hypothetical protein
MAWFSNVIDGTMNFLKNNALWIIIFLIIIFIFYVIYNKNKKKELKPLSRSEEERKRFIERMKLNKTSYKWLYRGKECIGKISGLMPTTLKVKRSQRIKTKDKDGKDVWETQEIDTGEKRNVLEMTVKPVISIIGDLKFVNPFGKEKCIMSNSATILEMDKVKNYIRIDEKVTFDKVFGIYYDRQFEPEMINYIQGNTLFRTDWDSFASVYFAKAQEQSTFDPSFAHDILKYQQQLEIEKQKRAKLLE